MTPTSHRRSALGAIAIALLLAAGTSPARADTFPSKPVRIVIPGPPGGTTDSTARLLAVELSRLWGQQVVVDNKPGGTGLIAQQALIASPPDGHVLGMQVSGFMTVLPMAHGAKHSPLTGTTPIAFVAEYPLLLATSAKSPFGNWKEFVAYTAANGGRTSYATTGIGGSPHLIGEQIKRATGLVMQDVPYKGDGPMLTDLVGGQVPIGLPIIGSALPMLRAGQIKGVAVTSATRVPFAPDVPTLKEQGVDVVSAPWSYFLGPPGMDPQLTEKIRQDVVTALKTQALKDFFTTNALVWQDMNGEQLRGKIKADTESGQALIKELKIPVN